MARISPAKAQSIEKRAKDVKQRFDDYQASVRLVAAFEAWLRHHWGEAGTIGQTLREFDRFPRRDALTPDFVASFSTHYELWGEVKKTWSSKDEVCRQNAAQLVKYAQWRNTLTTGKSARHDVLVLVATHSDDVACKALLDARKCLLAGECRPIVVVGYHLDLEHQSSGRLWYSLKWRDLHGNAKFSTPNVIEDEGVDLNSKLVAPPQESMRTETAMFDLCARCPVINDPPPPVYTVVRVVYPALSQILSATERDTLSMSGRIKKAVTRSALLGAPMLAGTKIPEGYLQQALDYMVEHGLAERGDRTPEPAYNVTIDVNRLSKDLRSYVSETDARDYVKQLVPTNHARRSRRRSMDDSGQYAFRFDV